MLLKSRRPMQSRLSLTLWRIAIEKVPDVEIRSRLLKQLKGRDDEEIAKQGWPTVLKGWRNSPCVDPADCVQGLPEELLFATVQFELGSSAPGYSARLFLAAGRISEMHFNNPIPLERQSQEPSSSEVRLNELFKEGGREPQGAATLQGPLAELARTHGVSDVGAPLSSTQEQLLLTGLEFQLPADYLEILRGANGFLVGPIEIYSLDATQTIEDQGSKYLLIGVAPDDRFLVVRHGSPNLLCVNHEFTTLEDLGPSLKKGIEALLVS